MKQAVLVRVQVSKELGCPSGNKAEAWYFRGGQQATGKGQARAQIARGCPELLGDFKC